MSNFDLTFCKVYVYAKGMPGINLGASHESCAHPGMTQNMDMTAMDKIFISNSIMNFKKWY